MSFGSVSFFVFYRSFRLWKDEGRSMTPLDAYSPDYKTARARFRSGSRGTRLAARSLWRFSPRFCRWRSKHRFCHNRAGECRAAAHHFIRTAWRRGIFRLGGTVSLGWPRCRIRGSLRPAAQSRLLHSLNPYGFANLRRANEDNVDLNRNFLAADDFARLRDETAPQFGPLNPYLNPPRPPSRINWFRSFSLGWRFALDFPFCAASCRPASMRFPRVFFLAASDLCRSTEIVMNESPVWVGTARQVIHLDFHTGLGRFGSYQLLSSDPAGSDRVRLAVQLFGKGRVKIDHEIDDGYHNHGDMGEWLSRRFADRMYVYLCAEFGTYNSTRVIGTLRRENQAHHWSALSSPFYEQAKDLMLGTFSPKSPGWRWSVVHQSLGAYPICSQSLHEVGQLKSQSGFQVR